MTSNLPDVSERLQHILAQWQSLMMVTELGASLPDKSDGVSYANIFYPIHWDKLHDFIFDNKRTELDPYEWATSPHATSGAISRYSSFPFELFSWNRESRRVFHLPLELQSVFASAEFPDMKWVDVLWPHDSFIITLEKPLVFKNPEGASQKYDSILVRKNSIKGLTFISVRALQRPTRNGVKVGVLPSEIREFRQLVKKRQYKKALQVARRKGDRMKKLYPAMPGSTGTVFSIIEGYADSLLIEPKEMYINQSAAKIGGGTFSNMLGEGEQFFPTWEAVPEEMKFELEVLCVCCRIAVSWMLYLESVKSQSLNWSTATARNKNRVGGAAGIITEPENLCRIVGHGCIRTNESTSSEGRSRNIKGFVRPHWRRSHYRRPAGSAPDAPKSQRIPAKLVRADLVPLYGIIGGTTTVVIADE